MGLGFALVVFLVLFWLIFCLFCLVFGWSDSDSSVEDASISLVSKSDALLVDLRNSLEVIRSDVASLSYDYGCLLESYASASSLSFDLSLVRVKKDNTADAFLEVDCFSDDFGFSSIDSLENTFFSFCLTSDKYIASLSSFNSLFIRYYESRIAFDDSLLRFFSLLCRAKLFSCSLVDFSSRFEDEDFLLSSNALDDFFVSLFGYRFPSDPAVLSEFLRLLSGLSVFQKARDDSFLSFKNSYTAFYDSKLRFLSLSSDSARFYLVFCVCFASDIDSSLVSLVESDYSNALFVELSASKGFDSLLDTSLSYQSAYSDSLVDLYGSVGDLSSFFSSVAGFDVASLSFLSGFSFV